MNAFFFFDKVQRYPERYSGRPYNWESRHSAHFSARHVSIHCDYREMIFHYDKGENMIRAISDTDRTADP